MCALTAGSLVAALTSSIAVMIAARVLQGLGGAVFPLAFGIIRDEFPRERVAGAIGGVSTILGVGGGLGIVLAGPIVDHLNYHWLFWIPLVMTALATVATFFWVPESPVKTPGSVNVGAGLLLSGWLVALLLGVSEGSRGAGRPPASWVCSRPRWSCSPPGWPWSCARGCRSSTCA